MDYYSLIKKSPGLLSFGFGINFFSCLGQTFYISLYNDSFRSSFSITHGELATLYGLATILGSFCMLALGWLLDKIDLRKFMFFNSLTVAFSCWLLSTADTVIIIFISFFLLRLSAQGLWGLSAQVTMARYFDKERGLAASFANNGFALGFAFVPIIGVWLIDNINWRDIWLYSCYFVLFLIIPLTAFQLKGHDERDKKYKNKLKLEAQCNKINETKQLSLKYAINDTQFWLIQPAILAATAIIFSIQFHQLYILSSKQWTIESYAFGYIIFSLMLLVGSLVAGHIVDKLGSIKLMYFYLWPLIPALLLLGYFDNDIFIFIIMTLTGFSYGMCLVAFVTVWAELYGTQFMGQIRTFNFSMNVLLTSAAMALTGWLIDIGVNLNILCLGGISFIIFSIILLKFSERIKFINQEV